MQKRPSFVLLIVALMLAEITCSLESNMIFVALSPLYAIYGDPLKVGWLITAFTLTSAASAAIGGRLGDLYGRRRMLLIMLAIGCFGSTLSAMATSLEIIIIGRIMQGSTMAILPLCFGLLREHVDKDKIGLGVSLLGATYSMAVGAGIVLGGVIVDNLDWQGVFVVSAIVAAIAFLAAWLMIPPSNPAGAQGRLDWVGGLLFAPAIAAILYGVSEAARSGLLGLPGGIVLGGLALLGVWAWYELRHPDPLLDLRLLARRRVALANGALFLTAVGPMMASPALLPLLQQPLWTEVGFALAATVAGFIMLLATGSSMLAILITGAAAKRISVRAVLVGAAMLNVIGWFGAALSVNDLWLMIGLILFVMTPGSGLVFATVPRIIIESAPPEKTSEATGMSQVIRSLGLAVGAQVVAICLASDVVGRLGEPGRFPTESAYVLLYIVFGVVALLALLLLLLLPRQDRESSGEVDRTDVAFARWIRRGIGARDASDPAPGGS